MITSIGRKSQKSKWRWAAGVAACVLATTIGLAGVADAAGISGHVMSDEAVPVAIQNVTVFATSAEGQNFQRITDAAGFFDFGPALPDGEYFLRTSNTQGYLDELHDNILCGLTCSSLIQTGTPVVVAGGVVTVDFALRVGGRVSGNVTTDDAVPVPLSGVQVQIIDTTGAVGAVGVTDGAGVYTTGTGLINGTYFARTVNNTNGSINELYDNFACPTFCTALLGTSFSVVEGATAGPINFALSAGGRVSGTVRDAGTLAGLASVQVTIADVTGRITTTAFTNGSGDYLTGNGLPAGTYYARVRVSGLAAQGHIEEVWNNKPCPQGCPTVTGDSFLVSLGPPTDIDFDLSSGGTITGTVTDASTGDPLTGVSVQIYDSSGRSFSTNITNVSGVYTILAGLPSGTYYARTGNALGYVNELYGGSLCVPSNCVVLGGTPIVVTYPGPATVADFQLEKGGRISGNVNSGGVPVRGANITIFDSGGFTVGGAQTNSAGDYIVNAGLPTGDYFARTNNGQGLINELYDNIICYFGPPSASACNVTSGTSVHVNVGVETQDIDFDLAPGGRVSGTITLTSSGQPVIGAGVILYDGSGTPVASGGTDALGRYVTFGGVATGDYYVRSANSVGLVNEIYDNQPCITSCNPTSGTLVHITASAITEDIDFALDADTDTDGDGILATVDTNPGTFSNDFTDIPLGGSTSGSIATRGSWNLTALGSAQGIVLQVQGSSASPARIDTCAAGGFERVILDAAAETAIVTCLGNSTTVRAAVANPTIELREPPNGPGTVIVLTSNQMATLGSPVTASPTNSESIEVLFVDAAGVQVGSMSLDPGESVDVAVDTGGNIAATVIEGVVTITVGTDTVTLEPGESQSFETPLLDAVSGVIQLVANLEASGAYKNQGAAQGTTAQLNTAHRELEAGNGARAKAALQRLLEDVERDYQQGKLTLAGRNVLVAAILPLIAAL